MVSYIGVVLASTNIRRGKRQHQQMGFVGVGVRDRDENRDRDRDRDENR